MRALALLLIVATCASCQRKETPQAGAAGADRPAKTPLRADAPEEKSAPKPLLKTKNILIGSTGSGFSYNTAVAKDPGPILADIATLPRSAAKDRAMESVLSKVAQADPVRARELLKQWPDGKAEAWIGVAQEIVRALGKTDPAAAREFILKEVPASLQIDAWGAFMEALPQADRPAILASLPEGSSKLRIAAAMITTWLPDDPAAVAEWLDEFATGRSPREIGTLNEPWHYISPRRDNDPLAWLAAFHAAETPEAQRYFAENALKYASPEQKRQWRMDFAEAVPDLKERAPAPAWYDNPAAWAKALSPEAVAALPPEEAREMIQHWGQKNARKAFDWALAQGRPEAAQALERLYYEEPKEAVDLASGVPAGKERDDALFTICQMAAHFGDGSSARELVSLISDPQRQAFMRQHVEERLKARQAAK
jgi:hypothetical protein